MAEKVPKDTVDYGPGDVDGQHCGACTHFQEPNRCAKVYGKIRSGGWCRLFERAGMVPAKEKDDGGIQKAAE